MGPSLSEETHVVIAGAGIAGLTAATILAEAGVRVTLCEAAAEAGGKAKSFRRADGHPTEHSLRIYLDYYQTLLTLLSRIPSDNGRAVLDNLVGISPVRVTKQRTIGRGSPTAPLERQRQIYAGVSEVLRPLRQVGQIVSRSAMMMVGMAQLGVPPTEVMHYIYVHLRLLWMCKERLFEELADVSYSDYLDLSRKSPRAQAFFSAFPRIFVAARPPAEAAAIAPTILKGMFHFTSRPPALRDLKLPSLMMMNGPTSERMIDPWIRHLENLGVQIHFNTRVGDLEFSDGRITALTSVDGRRFDCDYAILALPYLPLRELAKQAHVARHVPHLAEEHAIVLEGSNGMQCFLRDIPATWPSFIRPGVVVTYLESEWSLVSILQGEGFWKDVDLPEGTKYVLSITWSDVDTPGPVFDRPLSACTPEEILTDCLAQCGLDSSQVLGFQLDHELKYVNEADYESLAAGLPPHLVSAPAGGERMVNFSPLTVLMPGARHRSPRIRTEVSNLFLAGEAIYSPDLTFFVPTMEKAASSGYLAAQQIVSRAAAHAASRVQIPFRDPAPFGILRRLDRWLWNRRRPTAPPAGQLGLVETTPDQRVSA